MEDTTHLRRETDKEEKSLLNAETNIDEGA
jgi:hypothetical protein